MPIIYNNLPSLQIDFIADIREVPTVFFEYTLENRFEALVILRARGVDVDLVVFVFKIVFVLVGCYWI